MSAADRARASSNDGFGLLTEMMDAGCVAPDVAQRLGHPVGDRRVQRGRRVMVQIDRAWPDMLIVAFLLTLSNKRTRQRFPRLLYCAGLQPEAQLPGFQSNSAPSSRHFQREGEVSSDVEA